MNGAAKSQSAPNPSTGTAWQDLIKYYLSCLKQEDGFTDLLPRSNSGSRYALVKGGSEQLLSRPEGRLQVDQELKALIEKARVSGDSLFYGYPAFVHVEEVNGKTQHSLGALLVMELAWIPAPGEPMPTHLLPKSDEPFFHPRVFANLGLKDEQREELSRTLPPSQAMGSPESLTGYLKDLCETLNLRGADKLDPVHLDTAAEGTIDGTGIHNQAILFRADSSEYNRRLLQELEHLRGMGGQVAQTAARFLLDSSPSARG